MMLRITLMLEIFVIILAIHCIYGKQLKLNVTTCVFILSLMCFLEFINRFNINNISTIVTYVLILLYCLIEFRESIVVTIINGLFLAILITGVQFVCLLLAKVVVPNNEGVRSLLNNVLVLIFCLLILPKCKVHNVAKSLRNKNLLVFLSMSFASAVVFFLLMQSKYQQGIQSNLYIFAIPAILFIVLLLSKWVVTKSTIEQIENEVRVTTAVQEKYMDLLNNVRMRQHEFKNHIAAILSTHYAYHTYEQLVRAQQEYYGKVQQDNYYNNLLLLNDRFLCGFLYGKFTDIENRGVKVRYQINTPVVGYKIPINHLIEMLGILLDNATECTEMNKEDEDREIEFTIEERELIYQFICSNPFHYTSYSDIEKWFQRGTSTKGSDHGIGLSHLKQLCREWDCEVVCQNKNVNGKNQIEMKLEIKKEIPA